MQKTKQGKAGRDETKRDETTEHMTAVQVQVHASVMAENVSLYKYINVVNKKMEIIQKKYGQQPEI